MIVGVGIDVVEVARLARALSQQQGEEFRRRVFTQAERDLCAGRADQAQALAARFAAKEACFKALGRGLGEGVDLQEVEVVAADNGRPTLRLNGGAAALANTLGVRAIHVSLTHEQVAAAAVVILEA